MSELSIFDRLAAPFPPDAISWRVGSTTKDKTKGMALAYLDARDVMERLDAVCGPGGWQNRYSHVGGTTVCEIGINLVTCASAGEDHGEACYEWVWKADGAGATDVEAEKGALSDAFKRAAVRWGIGRYLYGLQSPWVALVAAGNSYKIADSEYQKLRVLLAKGPTNDVIRRLTSQQAKEAGLDAKINGMIDDCQTLTDLAEWDRSFDEHTAECPAVWLNAIKNRVILRKEEIVGEHAGDEMDRAFRETVG